MNPLDVVVRILNNQLSSLMWIDEKVSYLLLSFCWLMNCLSKLYKLWNLKIIDNRQRSSHLGFKRSHLRALVETVNWWWLQSTGCLDTNFHEMSFVAEMSDPHYTTLKIVYLLYHLEFGYWLVMFETLLLVCCCYQLSWTLNLKLFFS